MKIGTRVGAVAYANQETVALYGYGTYRGDEVPPAGVKCLGVDIGSLGIPNPKIVLDDGKVVWGCQCWWGPEEKVRGMVGDREVVMVDQPGGPADGRSTGC